MMINVKPEFREHFWEEPVFDDGVPEEEREEFWSLGRWPVKAKVGDKIFFWFDKQLVAEAVVSRVTKPGEERCLSTGKFENSNKVHWSCSSFRDLRGSVMVCSRVEA